MDTSVAYVNGVKEPSLTGGLKVTNVELAFAAGPYTEMVRAIPLFQIRRTDTANLRSFTGVVCTVAGQNLWTSLAANILTTLLNKSLESQALKSGEVLQISDYSKGFRYKVQSPYYLLKTGDNVELQLDVQASEFDQNMTAAEKASKSGNKTGKLKLKFQYYTGDGSNKITYDNPIISQTYYCNLEETE